MTALLLAAASPAVTVALLVLAAVLGLAAWGGRLEGQREDARRLAIAAAVLLASAVLEALS